jgi:hypothetical protein
MHHHDGTPRNSSAKFATQILISNICARRTILFDAFVIYKNREIRPRATCPVVHEQIAAFGMIEKSRLVRRAPRGTPAMILIIIGRAEKYRIGPAAERRFAPQPGQGFRGARRLRPTLPPIGRPRESLLQVAQIHRTCIDIVRE